MTIQFRAGGVPVDIAAPKGFAPLLAAAFADLIEPVPASFVEPLTDAPRLRIRIGRPGRDGWSVQIGDAGQFTSVTTHETIHECLIAINAHVAAARGVRDIVLHAASFRLSTSGGAVAVCGDSGTGKSTLGAAAVLSGHGYIADELGAIDPESLAVMPYHRPIGLRLGGATMLGIELPHDFGDGDDSFAWRVGESATLSSAAPLQLAVLLERHPPADGDPPPDGVEMLSPAQALVRLVRIAIPAPGLERETFRRIERLVHRLPVAVVRYGDCRDALRLIDEIAAGR